MKCFHCGECCRTLFRGMIVTSEEVRLLQETTEVTIEVEKIRENRFKIKNERCPFYEESGCAAYDVRPCQCRLFHCGRRKRDDVKIESIVGIRALMLQDPEYRRFKETTDAEAISWGNAHGWNWKRG